MHLAPSTVKLAKYLLGNTKGSGSLIFTYFGVIFAYFPIKKSSDRHFRDQS